MGVRIVQRQVRSLRLDGWALRRRVLAMLGALGADGFDVGVSCIGDRAMLKLNSMYRGIARPTDVLSFPFHDDVTDASGRRSPGTLPLVIHEHDRNLGDLFLGMPTLLADSRSAGIPLESQVQVRSLC